MQGRKWEEWGRTIIHSMSELWKCFVFGGFKWLLKKECICILELDFQKLPAPMSLCSCRNHPPVTAVGASGKPWLQTHWTIPLDYAAQHSMHRLHVWLATSALLICHFQGAEMEERSRQQKGHWFVAPSSYHCQAAAQLQLHCLAN